MRPAEWLRLHPLMALALAGSAVGMLVGALIPAPSTTVEPSDGSSWALPSNEVLDRKNEKASALISSGAFWGDRAGQSGAQGVKTASWQLTGIIAEPEFVALISVPGANKTTAANVGTTLPDGSKVVAIGVEGLEYERDGCRYERALYKPNQGQESGECKRP